MLMARSSNAGYSQTPLYSERSLKIDAGTPWPCPEDRLAKNTWIILVEKNGDSHRSDVESVAN
jgi:hypothetical protein